MLVMAAGRGPQGADLETKSSFEGNEGQDAGEISATPRIRSFPKEACQAGRCGATGGLYIKERCWRTFGLWSSSNKTWGKTSYQRGTLAPLFHQGKVSSYGFH